MTASARRFPTPTDRPDSTRGARLPRGDLRDATAAAWAPVGELTGPEAVRLLAVLAMAMVPAQAVPIRPGRDVWQLSVGTDRYATTKEILLSVMPDILADRPGRLP